MESGLSHELGGGFSFVKSGGSVVKPLQTFAELKTVFARDSGLNGHFSKLQKRDPGSMEITKKEGLLYFD